MVMYVNHTGIKGSDFSETRRLFDIINLLIWFWFKVINPVFGALVN